MHVELHLVEFAQQVIGKLDVGLVDLVDQQHRPLLALEGLPQLALDDVVANVLDPRITQLRVAQARHRVVLVKAVLRLGGRLDGPVDERCIHGLRDLARQLRLPGAGLALDQQRPLQGDRRIDGHHQIVCRDVGIGAGKTHGKTPRRLKRTSVAGRAQRGLSGVPPSPPSSHLRASRAQCTPSARRRPNKKPRRFRPGFCECCGVIRLRRPAPRPCRSSPTRTW